MNFLYEVPVNGCYEPRKMYIVKETARTYTVVSRPGAAGISHTVRKATMSTLYCRYYTNKEDAEVFYAEIHSPRKNEKTADGRNEDAAMKVDNKLQYRSLCPAADEMCGARKAEPRTDCKFYEEQRDMCAVIPVCTLNGELGNCPCEGCNKYVSKYAKNKIADEMFADIGYVIDDRREYGEGKKVYINRTGFNRIVCDHHDFLTITIENTSERGGYVEKEYHTSYPASTTEALEYEEILACAKLIKEMEENERMD